MIIKKYDNFINERLGVPDKIVNSATKLYNSIITDFQSKASDDVLTDSEFDVQIPITIQIDRMKFKSVKFKVRLITNNKLTDKVDVISWGVMSTPNSNDDYKFYYKKKKDDIIDLIVNYAISPDATFNDVLADILKDKNRTIGILSHELKHIYDKYKFGKKFLADIVDYQIWSETRTGFKPIDEFIYYLYFISKTESLVRPSEIAGELISSGITKSEFKNFLEDTSTYQNLLDIKNFSFENLKSKLMVDIENIRKLFVDLTDETDEEVIDTVLNITYQAIVKGSGDKMIDVLRLNDPSRQRIRDLEMMIFGMCHDVEFFNKYINKRIFNTKEDFFLFWEKKLNFEGDKVIRKIIKLYDMCKDDKVDPLMTKINQNGQCIVNPKLYNELIVKPGAKYQIKSK